MRILRVFLSFAAISFGILAFTYYQLPDVIQVEQQIQINVPQLKIYQTLNDIKQFPKWSKWFDADQQVKLTYTSVTRGTGAKLVWNSKQPALGFGSIAIIDSKIMDQINLEINFGTEASGSSVFYIRPGAIDSTVVWQFETDFEGDIISRFSGYFIKKGIANQYQLSLESLKSYLESS
jgi:uncharacterized membrane protein